MANKITKFASLGGSNIPYSQGSKKKKVSHMIATTLNFGIGSFFLTFSPQGSGIDDIIIDSYNLLKRDLVSGEFMFFSTMLISIGPPVTM